MRKLEEKIIKKRWWSAGSAEGGKRNIQFFFVNAVQLSFLSHSLTHSLAVIASEFNYFFFGEREKKKLSIRRSFGLCQTCETLFCTSLIRQWVNRMKFHTYIISLIVIDVADFRYLKATTGRRFSKGKIKGRPNWFWWLCNCKFNLMKGMGDFLLVIILLN